MTNCSVCKKPVSGKIYNMIKDIDTKGTYFVWCDNDYYDPFYENIFLICNNHNYKNDKFEQIIIPDHIPREQHNLYLKQLILKNDNT